MKKLISFLVTTILTIACGVCLYFCHKSGVLLGDGIESLLYAAGMLVVPFATCSILGIIYEAEIELEDSYTELWKVSLGVTIGFVVLGIIIVESKRKIFNIDPKLVIDAQIGLPMLINYLMSLWAIFRNKNNPNKTIYHSEEEYIRLRDSYILTREKLIKNAKNDLTVLHPLPRVNEISVDVDDDPRACYFEQALCGKYVRMALIMELLGIHID